jgi:RTX calcium-binding nonapeptide repeat (4 copies)
MDGCRNRRARPLVFLLALAAPLVVSTPAGALPDPTTIVARSDSPYRDAIVAADCDLNHPRPNDPDHPGSNEGNGDYFPGPAIHVSGSQYVGSPNSDLIIADGGSGPQTIYGSGGDDMILANDGADTVIGGPGRDYIFGDDGEDHLYGDRYQNGQSVSGANDNDCLNGGAGADTLVGDNAADGGSAEGTGNQNDVLMGSTGADTLIGDDYGGGDGDVWTVQGNGNDWLAGASGDDVLIIGDNYVRGSNDSATGGGKDSVNSGPADDYAVGDNYALNGADATIPAGQGADTGDIWAGKNSGLHTLDGNDHIYGDNYIAGSGSGTSSGGGRDTIAAGGCTGDTGDCSGKSDMDTIFAGLGDDVINADNPNDLSIFGPDTIYSGYGSDDVYCGKGSDHLHTPDADIYGSDCEDVGP